MRTENKPNGLSKEIRNGGRRCYLQKDLSKDIQTENNLRYKRKITPEGVLEYNWLKEVPTESR